MPPSRKHQALLRLFHDDPSLISALGITGPGGRLLGELKALPEAEAAIAPTGLAVDGVFLGDEAAPLAVAFEVQLRVDPRKRFSWPAYLMNLRMRRGCPAILVVSCVDANVARWARRPIDAGPGSVVTPHVISPHDVPRADRVRADALTPTLGVLSSIVHPDPPVLRAAYGAIKTSTPTRARLYFDILGGTRPDARTILEAAMQTDPQLRDLALGMFEQVEQEARTKGREEGREEGLRHALRSLLSIRRLLIPPDLESRLAAADRAQLDHWLARAATAAPGTDVLEVEP